MATFWKIIGFNYSDTEIGMYNWWSDELMKDLDSQMVEELVKNQKNEKHSVRSYLYDQELDFDFPDPPEFSI